MLVITRGYMKQSVFDALQDDSVAVEKFTFFVPPSSLQRAQFSLEI